MLSVLVTICVPENWSAIVRLPCAMDVPCSLLLFFVVAVIENSVPLLVVVLSVFWLDVVVPVVAVFDLSVTMPLADP